MNRGICFRNRHAGLGCKLSGKSGFFRGRLIEDLEPRLFLSANNSAPGWITSALPRAHGSTAVFAPTFKLSTNYAHQPFNSSSPYGFTPTQIRQAYGFDNITFSNGAIIGDGTGQTIAIIVAFDNPNIEADLHAFSLAFGLPDPPSFKKVAQDGSTNYPAVAPPSSSGSWALESALDVQWAHALAPGANIVLIEANSAYDADLLTASVNYAKSLPEVSVISMSFGRGEYSGDTLLNALFTTPPGHKGITFVASTGDNGAPAGFPSYSPNVLAVGGTTLTMGSGQYFSESGWAKSGGGISNYQTQPTYQHGLVTQSSSFRTTPDVSLNADSLTGVAVYDSWDFGSSTPWVQVGGTSFSAPAWAGLMAIADQGRTLAGADTLNSTSATMTNLYALPTSSFHDITTGNNGYAAGVGYDLVTGRGSPYADRVVAALLPASTTPSGLSLTAASDTGVSNSDGITTFNNSSVANTLQFVIGGTVSGATVMVYADGGLIGEATSSGSQTTVTTNGSYTLSNGVHLITARQIIAGTGLSAPSPSTSINIDTTAPTVSSQIPVAATELLAAQSSLQITFSESMNTNGFSIANHITSFTGPMGDIKNLITSISWTGSTVLTVNFSTLATAGAYQLVLGTQTTDLAGNALTSAYTAALNLGALIYTANMDTDPGWTLDAGKDSTHKWQWGINIGAGTGQYKDPTTSHSGSTNNLIGYNLGGNYATSMTATEYATTGVIDCTNYSNITLNFWRVLQIQGSTLAKASVDVFDGTQWINVWKNPTSNMLSSTAVWFNQILTLPSSLNGKSNVKIRWGIGTVSASTGYPGWSIDDVQIYGTPIAPETGQIFVDLNGNGNADAGDPGISGVTVYQDSNNNGVLEIGELTSVTSLTGSYSLWVPVNTQSNVRAVMPSGYIISTSAGQLAAGSGGAPYVQSNLALFPTLFAGTSGADSYVLSRELSTGNEQIVQTLEGGMAQIYRISSGLLSTLTFITDAGNDSLVLDLSNGSPLLATGITVDGGAGINTLTMQGAPTSGIGNISLNAAQLIIDSLVVTQANIQTINAGSNLGTGSVRPNVSVTGAKLNLLASQKLAILSLNISGVVEVEGNNLLLELGALVFNGGTLDLMKNNLLLHSGVQTDIRTALQTGYQAGIWMGTGLLTSSARTDKNHGLGYLSGSDYLVLHPDHLLAGTSVLATDIVITYAWLGDATLSGSITGVDFAQADASYLTQLSNALWINGDCNYDGVVDSADFFLLNKSLTNT